MGVGRMPFRSTLPFFVQRAFRAHGIPLRCAPEFLE